MTYHKLYAISYSMKVSDLFPRLETITDKLDRQNKIKVEFTSMKNKKNEKNGYHFTFFLSYGEWEEVYSMLMHGLRRKCGTHM